MNLWDGLQSKENEQILVFATTNRPFDLDDAVIRRLPRRLSPTCLLYFTLGLLAL